MPILNLIFNKSNSLLYLTIFIGFLIFWLLFQIKIPIVYLIQNAFEKKKTCCIKME